MVETIELAVPGGYSVTDDNRLIDMNTGEVVAAIPTLIPQNGTRLYTPHAQAIVQQKRAAEAQIKQIQINNEALGKFYFIKDELDFSELRPETLTRTLYLYSFLTPNREIKTRKRGDVMKRSELGKVLGLTRNTADSFWKEVAGKYFEERDGKIYGLHSESIFTGKIKWKNDENAYYQRVYRDGIRKLYKETKVSQHKQLGYIFALLPYVNYEYNVLCKNPDEIDKDQIETMSLIEFGRLIKYAESNLSRLRKDLSGIWFTPDGKNRKEPFVAFVQTGRGASNVKIVVNPRIIYGGQDYKKVEAFELFFKP